jgi:glycosyltransferase involved in cell wall biosynthesis
MTWIFDLDVDAASASESVFWSLDFPRSGTRLYGERLDLIGWAMGRQASVAAIEASSGGQETARAIPNLVRADVAAAFPDMPHARRSGFSLPVRVPLVARAEVAVSIILSDHQRVEAAVIRLTGRLSDRRPAIDAPLVSVVIPCYNQGRFLREAVESVRRQTYPRVEVIVVDDGSTDDTAAVADELRVRCIRQENRGLAGARNRGLADSTGEYVVFLDADDRLLPPGIEANVDAFAARPEVPLVAGSFLTFTSSGDPDPISIPPQVPPQREHYAALLACTYWLQPGSIMFRRDQLVAAGGFSPLFSGGDDHELCLRMTREHGMYAHDTPISEYRKHSEGLTRNTGLMLELGLAMQRAQRRWVWRDGSLRAAYRRGVIANRGYWGPQLAEDLAAALVARKWREAIRASRILLRRYPRGLLRSLSHVRHQWDAG